MLMTARKRSGMVVCALAALLAVFMLGETFAFWTQELWVANEYQLGKYKTTIVEEFLPPSNWQPGLDINKDVKIANEGTVAAFVKTQINMNWVSGGNTQNSEENKSPAAKDAPIGLTFTAKGSGEPEYGALVKWGKEVVLLAGGQTEVKSLRLGLPVVGTVQEAEGKWLLLNEVPDGEGALLFYYIGVLQPGTQTPLLVDSVEMNPLIEASILEFHTTYDRERQEWLTETVLNPTCSYEDARFTLTVNAVTVQASSNAVQDVFTGSTVVEQSVITHLAHLVIDDTQAASLHRDAKKENTLYFEVQNGEMRYSPVWDGESNWFMSFLNMMPGERYTDELLIENLSAITHKLYMQVVPRKNQSEQQDKLLEMIFIKVYYGDALIYSGTASGKEYAGDLTTLQNVVFLGDYVPNVKSKIRVELELSKDTPIEYCGLLTMIDWRFMVSEATLPGGESPKTGYNGGVAKYAVHMAAATAGFIVCLVLLEKERKREKKIEN